MNSIVLTAPKSNLKNFEQLFIEMTSYSLDYNPSGMPASRMKKLSKSEYMSFEKIRTSFSELKGNKIKYIHLCGAEPMLHPEFNSILRYCLKHASTVIHTHGYSINDKKAGFFAKVEKENSYGNEIVVALKLSHYDERKNDDYMGRGTWRKIVHALCSLQKNGYTPVVSVVNHENIDEEVLKNKYFAMFNQTGISSENMMFKIVPDSACLGEFDAKREYINTDCCKSRTLGLTGIYNCPFATSDYRCYSGADFNDFSKHANLELSPCLACMQNDMSMMTLSV